MFERIPAETEAVGKAIVHAAYCVHRNLGPGLLESVYETCVCYELHKQGVEYQRQVAVPIYYEKLEFEEGFRADIWAGQKVICELKAVETILPIHEAQLLTYLRLTNVRLGFLINFNVPLIKDGIHRVIL